MMVPVICHSLLLLLEPSGDGSWKIKSEVPVELVRPEILALVSEARPGKIEEYFGISSTSLGERLWEWGEWRERRHAAEA